MRRAILALPCLLATDDYLQQIRTAALALVRERLLLDEDFEPMLNRAKAHWTYATREQPRPTGATIAIPRRAPG